MSTRFELEDGLRRVLVTVLPRPQTRTVAQTILKLTESRPELGGWDWIIDIRQPHQQATSEELERIAAAFNAARSKQSYTVFISEDPATQVRCDQIGLKFLDRCHLVARTPAEARALIPTAMQGVF